MWRQQRADRLEAEVLVQLEQRHDSSYIGGYVPASPHLWDAARFSAVQRQQARLDRTFFRLLDELDRLTPADDEGGEEWPDEPESEATAPAEPANDDTDEQNEPNRPAAATVATPPAAALAAGGTLPLAPTPGGPLAERAAAERPLAEGRVKPVNDFLRAMLANKGGGGSGGV
jgi:hypothetical protein